jgi:hypothetical protein
MDVVSCVIIFVISPEFDSLFFGLLFGPEDIGDMLIRNVGLSSKYRPLQS